MSGASEIFVKLLGEAVDVWRPVQARHIAGNTYEISDQKYDRDSEIWEFAPGDTVDCEMVDASDGSILAATRQHS
jgi:hypothetical protein